MSEENHVTIRKEVILSLIPTAAYASLQPSAKDLILNTADMLVNYIIKGKEVKPSAPVKDKRKRAPAK